MDSKDYAFYAGKSGRGSEEEANPVSKFPSYKRHLTVVFCKVFLASKGK